jgi:hypothetical protein
MAADEYVMGPPPGYQPRTGDRQLPPEAYESAAERGRALVMKVLADCGIQKSADGKSTFITSARPRSAADSYASGGSWRSPVRG